MLASGWFPCWRAATRSRAWEPRSSPTCKRCYERSGGAVAIQTSVDLADQAGEHDGLGLILIATGDHRFLQILLHGMGSQRDHRNAAGGRTHFEPAGGFPSVDFGQIEIHQDQIGSF